MTSQLKVFPFFIHVFFIECKTTWPNDTRSPKVLHQIELASSQRVNRKFNILGFFISICTLVYEEICEILRHSDGICRVIVDSVFPPLVDILLRVELKAVQRVLPVFQRGYVLQSVRIFVGCHKSPVAIEVQLRHVLKHTSLVVSLRTQAEESAATPHKSGRNVCHSSFTVCLFRNILYLARTKIKIYY